MDITPEVLRQLYEVEGLTESEIAARLGTYQVRISRLRAKWGIPTRLKSDRLDLPPLTPEQHALLVGSLLGDGSLAPTGMYTARFSESHGAQQEDYLRWKASLLEPFTSSIIPTMKRDGDAEYKGWRLTTHGCRDLRPLYDQFYPEASKRFPKELPDLMDSHVLAVWYMDDGGLSSRFHPRVTFGLDERSLTYALSALRRLGLKPQLHTTETPTTTNRVATCGQVVVPTVRVCHTIHFPDQADKFYEMIRPHIPPCMAKKLPKPSARRDADRRARVLTPERARELHEGGMSAEDVARTYGVGRTTVRRRLGATGMLRMGRPRKAYSPVASDAALGNYDPAQWVGLSPEDQARWIDEVLSILRRTEFPVESAPDAETLLAVLGRVRSTPMRLEGSSIVPRSNTGTVECKGLFPNRYRAVSKGKVSAYEAWHDDVKLRAAIRFQLAHGDPVLAKRVLWAVCLEQRTPSVFRPTVAKWVYETYCPPGGTVWDPCSGYGGRVLGAVAAGVRYVGTDVEPETVVGNRRLAELLGAGEHVTLHQCGAEEFDPPAVDLVFTSPPYLDRERYSNLDEQSWRKHGSVLGAWVDGFLRPVIKRAYRALSPGRYLVLNVADLRQRGKVVPLVGRTVAAAVGAGFVHEATLEMPLAVVNRKAGAFEPMLVFRRP